MGRLWADVGGGLGGCLVAELTHPCLCLLWPVWQPGFPARQTLAYIPWSPLHESWSQGVQARSKAAMHPQEGSGPTDDTWTDEGLVTGPLLCTGHPRGHNPTSWTPPGSSSARQQSLPKSQTRNLNSDQCHVPKAASWKAARARIQM